MSELDLQIGIDWGKSAIKLSFVTGEHDVEKGGTKSASSVREPKGGRSNARRAAAAGGHPTSAREKCVFVSPLH